MMGWESGSGAFWSWGWFTPSLFMTQMAGSVRSLRLRVSFLVSGGGRHFLRCIYPTLLHRSITGGAAPSQNTPYLWGHSALGAGARIPLHLRFDPFDRGSEDEANQISLMAGSDFGRDRGLGAYATGPGPFVGFAGVYRG